MNRYAHFNSKCHQLTGTSITHLCQRFKSEHIVLLRTKLKQTEVDCEFLKRCCENLTEENRRLVKEVQELRALKSSPQFYMQMPPPTTLTMCPSCERVSSPPSSAASPSTPPVQPRQSGSSHHRPPFNPWAIMPAAHKLLNAIHHRSRS